MASSNKSSCRASDKPLIDIANDHGEDYAAYKDLRSLKRSQNRISKRSAKYYGFRGVDPNWIGQPYDPVWRSSVTLWNNSLPISRLDARPRVYTKRDMWEDRDFNIWPLDRRHHMGKKKREKRSWKYQERALGRGTKLRGKMTAFASDDISYLDDIDSVYDFSEERDYMFPVYPGFEDDLWSIPECFPRDDTAQQDPDIPDCDLVDGFVILHDSLWAYDKDEDYFVIERRDFDVISISSADSVWGLVCRS
ncbi:hypothetical protein LTR84_002723 [Exophiala bonariae]|uniref:BZIP domain-containing protein n=1 Tax=Exophiala bonariae TaxID=1690606 RepID=A0AAV9NAX0_9EURO|nr:hypothetical protein LTR84_002723 [Exophiala bonariae]